MANWLTTNDHGIVEQRATIENPRIDLQDPEAWDEFYNSDSKSASGMKVGPEKALMIASVWQAISMISGGVAGLPLDPYKRAEDDGREVDKLHPAWWVVRQQWNDELTAFRGWRTAMVHALMWNNSYSWIERNGRREPLAMYPLLPDRTSLERHGGRPYVITETTRDGKPWLKAIPYSDIFHIAGISLDGTQGAKMIRYARDAFGLSLARQGFASKFFKNGVRSGGILEIPLGSSEKFQKNVTEGFIKNHTGEDGWFKTVILRDGVKFHQTSFNAQEAQMNETSEETTREVARYFNLSPSRLGVKGSVSYNSKAEDKEDYLDSTLQNWLLDIASEANSKLLSEQQKKADSHFFEHNTRALLRMDFLKRVQAGSIGVKARLFAPNEWRKGENWKPLPGGDDLAPVQDPSKYAGGADKGENNNPRGPAATPGSDERSLETRREIFRLAEQARRKSADRKTFSDWVDRRLKETGITQVDEFVAAIRSCMDRPVAELSSAVDQISSHYERSV